MFRLRYYQNDAVQGAYSAWEQHNSTAIIIPTGTGKTEIYLYLAVQEKGRVLVIVHRDYLITSPIRRLERVGFHDVAIEKASMRSETRARRAQIVFASVQSIGPEKQARRLETFDPKEFSLVIVDEGHRAVSQTYRNVLNYFQARNPRIRFLILTATPKRKDGVALGNVCQSVAYEMSPGQAAQEGWIVPPKFFIRDVPKLDFSKVRMKGQDFDQDQLASLLSEEEPVHQVCSSLARDEGPTIVFCPKVAVAQLYSAFMERYKPGQSIVLHQESSDEERERGSKGLADGSIQYLFNVDLCTEGWDVPKVSRVAWAAPTASLVKWTQGCGRGFRPDESIAGQLTGGREEAERRRQLIAESPKPFCSIVTYFPSNCQHQICTAVDLLGGKDLGELSEYAKQVQEQTSRQGGGSDTEEDLETARIFLDLKDAVNSERKHIVAEATILDQEYDGLGGRRQKFRDGPNMDRGKLDDVQHAAMLSWGTGEAATEKQKSWFRWKGVSDEVTRGLTKWRACTVRDLYENGIALETALRWGRRQCLLVRDKIRAKADQKRAQEAIPE